MSIQICEFPMDSTQVADCIYGTAPHRTTNVGVRIPRQFRQELRKFLSCFNQFVGIDQTPYYRLDAYFDQETFWILEINASFVDGWGTALNLARASNIKINPRQLCFPQLFASTDEVYLPELQLFLSELAMLGLNNRQIVEIVRGENPPAPVYVYGRVGVPTQPNVFPYDGRRIDDKLNLAEFSRFWNGELVKVPRHYFSKNNLWEEIPSEVVLKFCDKNSVQCQQAGNSVLIGKPNGKAPFLKMSYAAKQLLAQDFVQPTKYQGENCQVIIMAIGDQPITGYTQFSQKRIINDNSTHGPLLFG